MAGDDIYAKALTPKDLSLFKALTPLSESDLGELAKIELLDVNDFSEPEVRSFIIDPIVAILGYRKGSDFSLDLGKRIEFLGKHRFPDYKFNLWQENFWLIEAKRPGTAANFGYDDLAQAIEYSIHPQINAALVVLCDGRKIEIFDREVSVTEPILRVERKNLRRDFDALRYLLEPWQVWFFQKRRIVRLIDKVFDKEPNLGRVEEFKSLIERRLENKRGVVLENFRRVSKPGRDGAVPYFEGAPLEELVGVHLFSQHPIPQTNALINRLVTLSSRSSFHVLYKIFPDEPRDANDIYFAQALTYLMALGQQHKTVNWLPAWLSPGRQSDASVEEATQRLLKLCLSNFENDEPRKIVLLAAITIRRIFRLLLLSSEAQWKMGEVLHFLQRFAGEELSWAQFVSSPQGHLVDMMEGRAMMATHQFVAHCYPQLDPFGGSGRVFKTEVGKLKLKELWKLEIAILGKIDNYAKLRKERDVGDMWTLEAIGVTHDFLGHMSLCLMHRFPQWKDYALREHRPMIEMLASLGSFSARDLLGIRHTVRLPAPPNSTLAKRFFYGDVGIVDALRGGYGGLV